MGTTPHFICYSNPIDHYSHRIRLVLAEKDIGITIRNVDPNYYPPNLAELNPYSSLPVLVERDLVLYDSIVIMEYLEDRYPYPPLLPAYPSDKANKRLLVHRIERDWCRLVDMVLDTKTKVTTQNAARKELRESLIGVSAVFNDKAYFLSNDLTLADCCLLPILWRLPLLEIEIPKTAKGLLAYMERGFDRSSFQASLSEQELKMVGSN